MRTRQKALTTQCRQCLTVKLQSLQSITMLHIPRAIDKIKIHFRIIKFAQILFQFQQLLSNSINHITLCEKKNLLFHKSA